MQLNTIFATHLLSSLQGCTWDPTGRDYNGTMNWTVNNRTCQRWDEQKPHDHSSYKASSFLRENYCRLPNNDGQPWCYTTDPDVR